MRITTKIRQWKEGEAAEMRTLCPEDEHELCVAATKAVVDMLKENKIDGLAVSVDLSVRITEAIKREPQQ